MIEAYLLTALGPAGRQGQDRFPDFSVRVDIRRAEAACRLKRHASDPITRVRPVLGRDQNCCE